MRNRILLAVLAAALAAPLAVQAAPLEERPPAPTEKPAEERAAEKDKVKEHSDGAREKGKEKADAAKERAQGKKVHKAELKQAARQCAALRKQLGKQAFAAQYPTPAACLKARIAAERAHRAEAKTECEAKLGEGASPKRVAACAAKSAAQDSAEERATVVNAAKACAEELSADPTGFRAEYGTSKNLANAFGKCVSAKASGEEDDDAEKDEDDHDGEDDHADDDETDEDEDEDEK